jgi:hypothetical protein
VLEYLARVNQGMRKQHAAEETAADWTRRPRAKQVREVERIGRHRRNKTRNISLGSVSERSLRRWAKQWDARHDIADLAPRRKGQCGRAAEEIPEQLIKWVAAHAAKTWRGDIAKAVELGRKHFPADEWPKVSTRTFVRRVREYDPSLAMDTIGKKGHRELANKHLPDVERDWDKLRYNELYEIDDVQMDFYCHSASDPLQTIRPYIYGIRRIATRQWVTAITSETPITAAQVNALVGFALASKGGGIPEHMTFERGTVALSNTLRELLEALGVTVHQASVDDGYIWSGAVAKDRSIGHSQSKAVFESNNRRLHNIMWDQVAQVGAEERHTAQQSLESLRAESVRRLKAGEETLLPLASDAARFIDHCMRADNARPHTGLPQIYDESLGKMRHMSPDEYAIRKKADNARLMDPALIPAFCSEALRVKVSRNGVRVGTVNDKPAWYGRHELQELVGETVTVYVERARPEVAYIEELGTCVPLYERARPFAADQEQPQIAAKKKVYKRLKNKFETMMGEATSLTQVLLERSIALPDPAAGERHTELVTVDEISRRAERMRMAAQAEQQRQAEDDARFDLDREHPDDAAPAPRRSRQPAMLQEDRTATPRRSSRRQQSQKPRASLLSVAAKHNNLATINTAPCTGE